MGCRILLSNISAKQSGKPRNRGNPYPQKRVLSWSRHTLRCSYFVKTGYVVCNRGTAANKVCV